MNKAFLFALFFLPPGLGAETINHDLKLKLSPSENLLEARDTITLPEYGKEAVFSLHKGLEPVPLTKGVDIKKIDLEGPQEVYGVDYSSAADIFEKYSVTLPPGLKTFTLQYRGVINHPLTGRGENYARSFSQTPGIISEAGCYLSGAAFWYPQFAPGAVTYNLETDLPEGWDSVSGGDRKTRKTKTGRTHTVWRAAVPQVEIILAAGRYKEYSARDKSLKLYVFLRGAGDELARKYLAAAARYIKMYSGLIGPYPYGKFALVENFWETGYGLPSFTLLGPKVIRLPFILNSSYPHEILHNWWGNGVFVDYEKGNWCEGLTAYLADYLISEGRGKGKDYRMTALQKYADYAAREKDFPLAGFRSRHSPASEAAGCGKALMFYHMLRRSLGDEKFSAGLKDFYKANKFKCASFDDLKTAFEKQTGRTRLDRFFDQWVNRTGAPELEVKNVKVSRELDEFAVEFTVVQKQSGPAYYLEAPVIVRLENNDRPRLTRAILAKKEEIFKYYSRTRPLRLEFDPEFDLFRKLNPLETPPTLSRLLGAAKPVIILPAGVSSETYRNYQAFASAWTKDKENLPEIIKDSDLLTLPAGRPVLVLGLENKFREAIAKSLEPLGARIGDKVFLNNQDFSFSSNTFVLAGFNPADAARCAGLIIASTPDKLALLAAKLPHYGKYGYLVFDDGMTAIRTGLWETTDSPLSFDLAPGAPKPEAKGYPRREPLAAPKPVFSAERKAFLGLIASFERQGKGARANSVTPGSPLSNTDFKAGDVLIKINDAPIADLKDCSRELAKYAPGDRIKITYLSDNREKTAEVELAAK